MVLEEFERWTRREVVKKIFPRDVGIPRKVADDEVDFIAYIEGQRGIDCYASVFARWQIVRRNFDTIFFDIDAHNSDLQVAYENLMKVLDALKGYDVRVYFTGRGFHVFCYFPLARLEHYGMVCREWAKRKGITEYVDMNVVGDMRRMARIPLTVNANVDLTMIAVDVSKRSLDDIVKMAREGKSDDVDVVINDDLAKELQEIENEMVQGNGDDNTHGKLNVEYEFEFSAKVRELPRCIRDGIMILAETGELDHHWRVAMSIFLLKVLGFKKTKELFEMFADDYRECTTKYQLRFIQSKGYKCYSCYKLKLMGICQHDKQDECPFYVLSNGWLENMVGDWE